MTYHDLWQSLLGVYDEREARAVVLWLLEVVFGLSRTDVVCGGVERLDEVGRVRLQAMMNRLLKGEPVQYVVGVADFGPRQFLVNPNVLIPRPETYELCQWITSQRERGVKSEESSLLDIGTGSGCIACTLSLDLPGSQVAAWDVSEAALAVAKENAETLRTRVDFVWQDTLTPPDDSERWDIIVSNPPYVCRQEQAQMERHVLDHEPHTALFVPNDDPLLFYRAIVRYARKALKSGGQLFFELNAAYADDTRELIVQSGFQHVELKADQFGRLRFLKASRP